MSEENKSILKKLFRIFKPSTWIQKNKAGVEDFRQAMLMNALSRGDIRKAGYLADHGIDINAQNSQGNRLLHTAVACGNKWLVQWLINHGANVNLPDNSGEPPLYMAVFLGNSGMVNLLLDEKANPNVRANDGQSLLDYAIFWAATAKRLNRKEDIPVRSDIIHSLVDAGVKTDDLSCKIRNLEQDGLVERLALASPWVEGNEFRLAEINAKLSVMHDIIAYKENKLAQQPELEKISHKNRQNVALQTVKERDE